MRPHETHGRGRGRGRCNQCKAQKEEMGRQRDAHTTAHPAENKDRERKNGRGTRIRLPHRTRSRCNASSCSPIAQSCSLPRKTRPETSELSTGNSTVRPPTVGVAVPETRRSSVEAGAVLLHDDRRHCCSPNTRQPAAAIQTDRASSLGHPRKRKRTDIFEGLVECREFLHALLNNVARPLPNLLLRKMLASQCALDTLHRLQRDA
jgi:hypothetical protein